jgi:hypothetical protein
VHVGSEDPHIEIVINSSSVNCVFKYAIDFLPLDSGCVAIIFKSENYSLSSFQVSIRKLIVFCPSLGNVGSSFLNESMEPREDEEKLSLLLINILTLCWSDILECPLKIVSNSRRCFISDFKT